MYLSQFYVHEANIRCSSYKSVTTSISTYKAREKETGRETIIDMKVHYTENNMQASYC